jgi:flagellar biosynthetic protein FlhB
MAEEDQNKSEQASQFKLKEAQKRGSVAKSMDINSFVALSSLAIGLSLWGKSIIQKQLRLSEYTFSNIGKISFAPQPLVQWVLHLFFHTLLAFLPLFILLIATGVLSNVFQTGPVFSTHPLKPDFKKINPAESIKRLFSMRIIVEAVKSTLKTASIAAAVFLFIRSVLPTLLGLGQSDFKRYPIVVLNDIETLIRWCLIALALWVLIDLLYVRREYRKKMMMSRRELTEEHKQREGDPRIRAKIRELQKEARKRSKSLRSVKNADVLITNPTRLAIALRYDRQEMSAPVVIAKGAGQLAKLMREMAFRHQIPVVENKKLAAALFRKVSIDSQIPEDFYAVTARLLMWVYARRTRLSQMQSMKRAS